MAEKQGKQDLTDFMVTESTKAVTDSTKLPISKEEWEKLVEGKSPEEILATLKVRYPEVYEKLVSGAVKKAAALAGVKKAKEAKEAALDAEIDEFVEAKKGQ